MKLHRFLVLLLAVTLLTAVPMLANDDTPRAAGVDIVRMWNARVSGDTILLFVRQSDLVFTADDIATMAEAGLPDRFIRQLLKEAGYRDDGGSYQTYYPRYDPYYYGSPYPWWFYGGHTVLDLHLGGHFGGHHYGSIGHHGFSTIGHRSGGTRHSGGSHGYSPSHGSSGSHRGSGHVSGGGHSSHGSSGGHHSGGGHSSGGHHGGH